MEPRPAEGAVEAVEELSGRQVDEEVSGTAFFKQGYPYVSPAE
jgi:hypothetical protein